ncbi:DUF4124 domain-containing protein [Pinirhizobacter sp.]|jgi:hypothetical protein|uniref:DUF4124 domain-containing protein n=1 Tax=Pinirhizobacter sp. TaxID=2950432 RepID=UPI002F414457
MRTATSSLMVVLALWAGVSMAQEVYKWKDASGVTHYDQQPPVKVKANRLQLKNDPAAPLMPASASTASSGANLNAADAAYRRTACDTARHNLQALLTKGIVVQNGTVTQAADPNTAQALNDKQRIEAKGVQEALVRDNCEGVTNGS